MSGRTIYQFSYVRTYTIPVSSGRTLYQFRHVRTYTIPVSSGRTLYQFRQDLQYNSLTRTYVIPASSGRTIRRLFVLLLRLICLGFTVGRLLLLSCCLAVAGGAMGGNVCVVLWARVSLTDRPVAGHGTGL